MRPGNSEVAKIANGKVTVDVPLTFGALEFTGGTIDGTNSLTLSLAASSWTGGEFSGPAVNLNGLSIGAGITKKITAGTLLTLGGSTTWNDDNLSTGGGAIINNTGNFTANANAKIAHDIDSNRATFTNNGTFNKATAGTATELETIFTNNGSVNVSAGTLKLSGGGSSAGNVTVDSGASLQISGADYAFTGGKLEGAGSIDINGAITTFGGTSGSANLNINGGTARFSGAHNTTGTVTLSSGKVDGTSTATVGGFAWNGGEITGVTINSSGTTIGAGGPKKIGGGAQLNLDGTTTWNGDTISTGGGARIRNSGTVNVTGDGAITQDDVATARAAFENNGTFNKTGGAGGTAKTEIQATFANTGNVNATAGTLVLSGGGSSSGVLNVARGAALNLGGEFAITGGNVTGAGTTTFTGNGTWSGGDMTGSGTTLVASGGAMSVSGPGSKRLFEGTTGSGGRTISNLGTITWEGGNIYGGDGAQIRNESGGTFDVRTDATLAYAGFGNGATFTNAGTLKKSAGSGTATIASTAFNNTGAVEITSGTLALDGGGASTGGQFNVGNGSRLVFGGNYTLIGAKIGGSGRTSLANSTLFVGGGVASEVSGTLELAKNSSVGGIGTLSVSGTLEWLGGDMVGTGLTSILGGGKLALSGSDQKRLFEGTTGAGGHGVDNAGTVTLDGSGALLLGDGASFINRAGGNFELRSDTGLGYTGFGNGGTFANSGNFTKSAGNGVSTISGLHFTNNGTVSAQSGTLAFNDAVTNNGGAFQASAGATIQFGGNASRAFGANTLFTGGGSHVIANGASAFNGDFTAQNLRFEGGSLTGPASLHGTMAWTGGDWMGNATFTVASDGALTLDGAGDKRLFHGANGSDGRIVSNQGTIVWQGAGNLLLGDGAQLSIASGATFDIRNDAALAHTGFGNAGAIVNNGTIVKNAGPGTTTIAQPFTQNASGRIVVNLGTLAFTSSFTNNGAIHLGNNATLSTTSTLDLHTFSGNGTLRAPTVVSHGVLSPGNSPGLLNITGNLTLLAASTLLIELGGTSQGTSYDYLNVSGTATLAGNLAIAFVNGFESTVTARDTFTIMTTSGLLGAFVNAPSGQRIFTADGLGSFQIDYGVSSGIGANNVVLSHFAYAVPEPSTWALLGLGSFFVLFSLFRKRSR